MQWDIVYLETPSCTNMFYLSIQKSDKHDDVCMDQTILMNDYP